jgi:hypothetical protein
MYWYKFIQAFKRFELVPPTHGITWLLDTTIQVVICLQNVPNLSTVEKYGLDMRLQLLCKITDLVFLINLAWIDRNQVLICMPYFLINYPCV